MTLTQYQAKFRAQVYALMRDAFEESFVPGSDVVKTPKTPIMMKPDFYRLMADIAVKDLARGGVRAPAGFDINAEAKRVFSAGGGSAPGLRANPGRRPNPSSPRMFPEMYDAAMPFFSRFFGVASARKNPGETSRDTDLMRQFKATQQHLSALYFRQAMRLPRSAFEYPARQGGAPLPEDVKKQVVLNQYRNYVMSALLMQMTKLAYDVTPTQLDRVLAAVGASSMTAAQLESKDTRLELGRLIARVLGDVFGSQRVGDALIDRLGRAK